MVLEEIQGGLIVSCQALEEEPLHSSLIMSKMAKAAVDGGAVGIRANTAKDIQAIRKETNVPIIGIVKQDYEDSAIYITPTMHEVEELLTTDCEIIALDATDRKRPGNTKIEDLIKRIHDENRLAMADISTMEEAKNAEKLGFDLISTTLAGYTDYSKQLTEPDFNLVQEIAENLTVPVVLEGHTRTPEHVVKGLKLGAWSAVVGSIITRPQVITKLYTDAIKEK